MRCILSVSFLAMLGWVRAQTPTLDLLVEPQPVATSTMTAHLVGSVVGSESNTKTVEVNCASGVAWTDCPIVGGITYTQGPSSWAYEIVGLASSGGEKFTWNMMCKLDDQATCTYVGPQDALFTTTTVTRVFTESIDKLKRSVTITAGAEKLEQTEGPGSAATSVTAKPVMLIGALVLVGFTTVF